MKTSLCQGLLERLRPAGHQAESKREGMEELALPGRGGMWCAWGVWCS